MREESLRRFCVREFERAEEEAQGYLTDYYAWLGDEVSGYIASSAAKDAETVQQYLAAFEEAGCGELIFCPSSSESRLDRRL